MFKRFKKKAIEQSKFATIEDLQATEEKLLEEVAKKKSEDLTKEMDIFLKKELPCLKYTLQAKHWKGYEPVYSSDYAILPRGIRLRHIGEWDEEIWQSKVAVIVKPLKSSKDTFEVSFTKMKSKREAQDLILYYLNEFNEQRKLTAKKDREFKKAFCK